MNGKTYGYMLCHDGQRAQAQGMALQKAGVPKGGISVDMVEESGLRPAYREIVEKLMPGDALVICAIDHLGKNYGEILSQWKFLTEEKRVAIVVLDTPHLDTREGRELDGKELGGLVSQLLSQMAQVEYGFFRQRQAKGIADAKARGVKFGRRPMQRTDNYRVFYEAWKKGDISARSAAKFLGVDHHTFLKWARNEERNDHWASAGIGKYPGRATGSTVP